MKTIVIGIAGGSGSGKTTLAHKLKDALGDDIVLLCHDFYYKAHDDMPFEERQKLNFDHPDAFDTDLLIEDIRALKRGESILHPLYSFTEHTRLPQRVRIDPARVVIVEGILIFENKQLRDEMDIKVFVDTDADIRLIRRLLRDVQERGRTLDSVVNQYMNTVKPMHEQFVEPSKKMWTSSFLRAASMRWLCRCCCARSSTSCAKPKQNLPMQCKCFVLEL